MMLNATYQFFENHWLLAILLAYYSSTNLISFSLYGWDKAAARSQKSRIAEQTLHTLAFAGGAVGALCAQSFFRHKTQKPIFKYWGWFCLSLHTLLILFLLRAQML